MVKLLNGYLDEACEIVIRHGGTIDKIVGDALHVMFNAPVLQQDHASRAVACAIELDRWAMAFKAKRNAEGIALGVTRIGVNTGTVVIGNFGGRKRFDYTAHGDAVNVTARLESINKTLGTTVCISEATVERCSGVEFRPVAKLVLYGKEQGVRVYSPVNPERDPRDLVDEYRQAYQLMEQESEDAAKAFEDLAARFPDDRLIALHNERLARGDSGETVVCSGK
jgi:adenylate cyclase